MTRIDVVPQVYDLHIYAGDAVTLDLELSNPDETPFDASGTIQAQIRKARNSPSVSAAFSVNDDDAAEGKVTLSLTGAQTAALTSGVTRFKGQWDCQWTSPDEVPLTLVQGSIICDSD